MVKKRSEEEEESQLLIANRNCTARVQMKTDSKRLLDLLLKVESLDREENISLSLTYVI